MKLLKQICFSAFIVVSVISCEINHIPDLPFVIYDDTSNVLNVIQTDTTAHDTLFINICDLVKKQIPINDTISINVAKLIKEADQLNLAYKLISHKNELPFEINTSRTRDTSFIYKYQEKEIKQIPVASITSGPCLELYDINYNRNYRDKIRLWIFKNGIEPDSMLIERMNELIKQFNYSGYNEYSKKSGGIPILTSIQNCKYKIKANVSGSYFYLYACHTGSNINKFVESKIKNGLTDANRSIDNTFNCYTSNETGVNIIFLISIDENWKYNIIPAGMVIIDNIAPKIIPGGVKFNSRFVQSSQIASDRAVFEEQKLHLSSSHIYLKDFNILVNMPDPGSISSTVRISYGQFQGDDYFGYNIPFYINYSGDIKSISIGSHNLNTKSIVSGQCVRLHIRRLHIGDNYLPITATDTRGNKSSASLSIPLVAIRNNNNSYNDGYDDLEDRIDDLENRLNELEE